VKRSFFALSAFAATLSLATLTTSPAQAASMTAAEIQSEMVGKQLSGRRLGITMNILLNQDGTAVLESTIVDDEGVWRMNGDQLCMKWNEFRGGKEQCSDFSREKGGYRMEGGPLLKTAK